MFRGGNTQGVAHLQHQNYWYICYFTDISEDALTFRGTSSSSIHETCALTYKTKLTKPFTYHLGNVVCHRFCCTPFPSICVRDVIIAQHSCMINDWWRAAARVTICVGCWCKWMECQAAGNNMMVHSHGNIFRATSNCGRMPTGNHFTKG